MNRFLKTAILSIAVGATTLATLPAAEAGEWRRHHRHRSDGDLVAAGVLGLAVGALAVGALSNSRPVYDDGPVYVERPYRPRPRPVRDYYNYVDNDVVYADSYAAEPWTPEWYRYCEGRYRSFNARTGTFTGYDGAQHFCVAN